MSQASNTAARSGCLLLVASCLLSACGGGGDSASPAPAPSAPAPAPAPVPPPPAPAPAPAAAIALACPAGIDSGDITPGISAAPDCDAANFDTYTDIAYAQHSSGLLDLLVPRNGTAERPLVVWVHGGGWRSGDKTDRAQAQRLVCRGYALAAINYRLSDSAIFPAQIHDVKAAIRFLRANAANYGLDSTRIAVFGSSAGGHLAALAATGGDVATLEDLSLGNSAVSSRVQAVVDWYGPTRLTSMDTQLVTQGCPVGGAGHNGSTSAESQLLGCTLGDASCAAQAQSADPTQYARAAHPPHLILHGSEDCNVPAEQSAVLARAIAPNGSCVVQRRVVGAGHGGPSWTSPEVQDATAQFLDRVLNRPTASPVVVNCAAFAITGDATAANGARWTYQSTDDGVAYNLNGVLFAPSGNALAPGVVVSHGKGGSATGYSSTVARTMRDWGMVAIATNYNHAPDNIDAGQLPQGDDGASTANVQRAHKARDLLSCIANVDMRRLAAHGHSMGGFVTGQMLGTFPGDFRAASHSAGGATEDGPNATRASAAAAIRTPYQLHHGDADTVVVLALDQALQEILATNGAVNQLHVYSAYSHEQIAFDALMLERVRDWYRAHGVL